MASRPLILRLFARREIIYFPEATGGFQVWDEAEGGRWSQPPAFHSRGGGLVCTADDYHAYLRMLAHQVEPAVSL